MITFGAKRINRNWLAKHFKVLKKPFLKKREIRFEKCWGFLRVFGNRTGSEPKRDTGFWRQVQRSHPAGCKFLCNFWVQNLQRTAEKKSTPFLIKRP